MVKFTVWNEKLHCEQTKFACQLNVYGIGEELLFPIRLNDGKSETNLATYLVKTKRFPKTSVKIVTNAGKDGLSSNFKLFNLKISI